MTTPHGKVAAVTGASKGIGAATAARLAADGYAVVVNYHTDAEGARRVVNRITAAGGRAVAVQADLGEPAQAALPVERAVAEFGRLDVLVNNAGVFVPAPLDAIDAAHVDRHLRVNVTGLLLASQAAARAFAGQAPSGPDGLRGVIVNVSSAVATQPLPGFVAYASTKGAVDTITRALAHELGPRGVRVVAVAPGLVASEGVLALMPQDAIDAASARNAVPRAGRPADIADAVAFAASGAAPWMTGTTLAVDGGFRP